MPTLDQIRHNPWAAGKSDEELVFEISGRTGRPPEVVAYDFGLDGSRYVQDDPGLTTAFQNSLYGLAGSLGQVGQDVTGGRVGKDLERWGDMGQYRNPVTIMEGDSDSALSNLGSNLVDQPFNTVGQIVGSAAGYMLPSGGLKLGLAGLRALRGAEAAAGASRLAEVGKTAADGLLYGLPSYGGIRDTQEEMGYNSAGDMLLAAGGALTSGMIEGRFGPEAILGHGKIAPFIQGPGKNFFRTGLKTGAVEAGEELMQNPIEQLASYQNPLDADNIDQTLAGGLAGFVGGKTFGVAAHPFMRKPLDTKNPHDLLGGDGSPSQGDLFAGQSWTPVSFPQAEEVDPYNPNNRRQMDFLGELDRTLNPDYRPVYPVGMGGSVFQDMPITDDAYRQPRPDLATAPRIETPVPQDLGSAVALLQSIGNAPVIEGTPLHDAVVAAREILDANGVQFNPTKQTAAPTGEFDSKKQNELWARAQAEVQDDGYLAGINQAIMERKYGRAEKLIKQAKEEQNAQQLQGQPQAQVRQEPQGIQAPREDGVVQGAQDGRGAAAPSQGGQVVVPVSPGADSGAQPAAPVPPHSPQVLSLARLIPAAGLSSQETQLALVLNDVVNQGGNPAELTNEQIAQRMGLKTQNQVTPIRRRVQKKLAKAAERAGVDLQAALAPKMVAPADESMLGMSPAVQPSVINEEEVFGSIDGDVSPSSGVIASAGGSQANWQDTGSAGDRFIRENNDESVPEFIPAETAQAEEEINARNRARAEQDRAKLMAVLQTPEAEVAGEDWDYLKSPSAPEWSIISDGDKAQWTVFHAEHKTEDEEILREYQREMEQFVEVVNEQERVVEDRARAQQGGAAQARPGLDAPRGNAGEVRAEAGAEAPAERPKYSRAEAAERVAEEPAQDFTPTTAEAIRKIIKDVTGRFDNNRIKIFDTWTDAVAARLTGTLGKTDGSYAWVEPDLNTGKYTAVFIADRIPAGQELAVFMHEVGSHLGMAGLIGEQNTKQLAMQIKKWAVKKDGSLESVIARRAMNRVKSAQADGDSRNADLVVEERIAYFVEEAVKAGVNPLAVQTGGAEFRQWFRTLWAAVKAALRKIGFQRFDKLTAQNLVDLAYGAARLELAGTWHGTASDFRNFNHDYMGTGEGAQAFGWGTYLAQRVGIAKGYWEADVRRKTRADGRGYDMPQIDGQSAGAFIEEKLGRKLRPRELDTILFETGFTQGVSGLVLRGDMREALQRAIAAEHDLLRNKAILEGGLDYGETLADAEAAVKRTMAGFEEVLQVVTGVDASRFSPAKVAKPDGSLMRVDVAVKDDELLDWDKPLREQNKMVKLLVEAGVLPVVNGKPFLDPATTGAEQYRRMAHEMGQYVVDGQQAASEYLDSIGIKGIKFLDASSRGVKNRAYYQAQIDKLQAELDELKAERKPFDDAGEPVARFAIRQNQLEDLIWRTKQTLNRLPKDETRNLVIFNDKNVQRVVTQVGAKKDRVKFSKAGSATAKFTDQVIDAAPAPAQKAMHTVVDTLEDFSGRTLNYSMFTNDLVEKVSDVLTSAKAWYEGIRNRETLRIAHEAKVDDIANLVDQLPAAKFNRTWGLIKDMTKAGKWGYAPTWRKDVTVDPAMQERYNALDKDEQSVIDAVFKMGDETIRETQAALDALADEIYGEKLATAKDDRIKAKLEKEKGKFKRVFRKDLSVLEGPYAPMRRVGSYVTAAKSARYADLEKQAANGDTKATDELMQLRADGKHYQVVFSDSLAQARAVERELHAAGFPRHLTSASAKEVFTGEDQLPFQAFEQIRQMAMAKGEKGRDVEKLMNLIDELYLTSLADTSARKSELRRTGVEGLNPDTMYKAFLSKGKADAHYLSILKTHQQVSRDFTSMREESKSVANRADKMDAFNELKLRYENSFNFDPSPLIGRLMNISAMWYLMTKPAYYLYNLTQPLMMAQPYIAQEHGYGAASGAMTKAYNDLLRSQKMLNLTHLDVTKLPEDIRQAMVELRDAGRIDITITQDLGSRLHGGNNKVSKALSKVERVLRTATQKTEMVNRIVTAAAAYRLELVKTKDHAAAVEYAKKVVDRTQGDYSNFNAPRLLNATNFRKLITQFRKFQFIQASLLIRMVNDSLRSATPHERAMARRALMFTLGHHAVLAGALGLPLANVVAMAFSMTGGDDEPRDLELWMRRELGDNALADLLMHGVPAVFNVNVSSNVGMGQTFSVVPFADVDMTGAGFKELTFAAMGPVFGLGRKGWEAMGKAQQGDYYGFLAGVLPGAASSSLKAVNEFASGVENKRGDVLVSPDEISFMDSVVKALGFKTQDDTIRQLVRGQQYEFEQFFKDRTTEVKKAYTEAYRDGDHEEMMALRERWQEMQEFRREYGFKPQPLSALIKAPAEQRKREAQTIGGVQYNSGNKGFVSENAAP